VAMPAFALRSRDRGVRIVSATEQAFLSRFPRGEIRVFEAFASSASPDTPESATILVRYSGGQALVVGYK
jgi:hypothetical protein